jgi:hypothetical protein
MGSQNAGAEVARHALNGWRMPDLGSSGAGGHRRGPAWSRRDGAAWRARPARNADPVWIKWQHERCDLICSDLQGPIGSFARSSPKRTEPGYHLLTGLGFDRSERACLRHQGGIATTTHFRTSGSLEWFPL